MPSIRKWRVIYGALIGIAMAFTAPEIALLLGNILSILVNPSSRRNFTLRQITELTPGIFDFVFLPDQPLKFLPGQYLEWTLPPAGSDSRGNRRYFTIASSPTESEIHLGIKIPPHPSSFKQELTRLKPGSVVTVGQLAGDFTLPENRQQKMAFIAGGIGITPFRSMVKYLSDRHETRSVILFYLAKPDEFVYREIFTPIRTVYNSGRLTPEFISNNLPDFQDYLFYLSGPQAMINAYKKVLSQMHIPRSHVKTDYFPGF